jgi:hypothetical protein
MTSTTTSCSACGRQPDAAKSLLRCGSCKIAGYCSPACQKVDWKRGHKKRRKILPLKAKAVKTAAEHTGDTVAGVRLPCQMDARKSGSWHNINIESNHPIFDNELLEVPALMGIPLVIHRVGTQSANRADLDNRIATFFNIPYDTGFAPPEWQSHVGTCLIARKDKKPLSSEHMEAVYMYIDRLLDIFGDDGPKKAQSQINKDDFEEWFEHYKESATENGRNEWHDVGSIYDV